MYLKLHSPFGRGGADAARVPHEPPPQGQRDAGGPPYFLRRPYQMPLILTSLGALEPRSVSEGCTDVNTPAISPVSLLTLAVFRTMLPLSPPADLVFSFSSASWSAAMSPPVVS